MVFKRNLQNFPRYVINFATRFATGSYASPSTILNNTSTQGLSRDPFGFRQIIIAGTNFGKVYGIDSSNGVIIWSRILDLPKEGDGEIIPMKLHVTKTVSDDGDPEVVIVAQRRADNVRILLCLLVKFDILTHGALRA